MDSLSTQLIHAGEPEPRFGGAVAMPIFQSANFVSPDPVHYVDVVYARLNNTPNHTALHAKLAAIEGAEAALVTGSGMAAISSALMAVLSAGDHILVQKTIYGGTHSFITQDLKKFGVEFDFIEADKPDTWAKFLKPRTRAIYVETVSNPTMEVPELQAVVDFAHSKKLVSLIDNTFATPVNFRPVPFGFDISLHSATKYLNGHSDVVAGAVIASKAWIEKVNHTASHLGGMLDPHACFLLHRGMKTLFLRMQYQNASALKVAKFLSEHPTIVKVNYPGLEKSPHHERAKKYLGGFGGMVSFEVKGDVTAAEKFMGRLKIPIWAASLGGVESLVISPARSSHLGIGPEERAKAGVTDTLIRLSVGIEDTNDLIEDLNQALKG